MKLQQPRNDYFGVLQFNLLAWPSLQSLAVKKNFFFVQILGGEKLLKFGEKWAVKHF